MSKRSERIKVAPLLLSKSYMRGHSKAGEPTNFKQALSAGTKKHTIRENYNYWAEKAEQINAGKMVLSLRQWQGRPYNSDQEELLVMHKLRVQAISINIRDGDPMVVIYGAKDRLLTPQEVDELAANDGLSTEDFLEWMCPNGQPFNGVILHLTDDLIY